LMQEFEILFYDKPDGAKLVRKYLSRGALR